MKDDSPRVLIESERLVLRASDRALAAMVADFFTRNQEHIQKWSPVMSADQFSESGQDARLALSAHAFQVGMAWQWWISEKSDLDRVIGHVHYSQVVRGVFQNAMLGYALDAAFEGKGIMREAIQCSLDEVFNNGHLHRVQANVQPNNHRSLATLERLNFAREGYAKDYLYLDGAWRDHMMFAILNPKPLDLANR